MLAKSSRHGATIGGICCNGRELARRHHVSMLRGIETRECGIEAAMPSCALQETVRWRRVDEKFRITRIKVPRGAFETQEVFRVPRYFFHLRRGQLTVIDKEGIELSDVEEAAKEAARRGRQIAESDALKGILAGRGLIIVEDEWDENVLEHPF
jgi:uncharacterized protein DUF6894